MIKILLIPIIDLPKHLNPLCLAIVQLPLSFVQQQHNEEQRTEPRLLHYNHSPSL